MQFLNLGGSTTGNIHRPKLLVVEPSQGVVRAPQMLFLQSKLIRLGVTNPGNIHLLATPLTSQPPTTQHESQAELLRMWLPFQRESLGSLCIPFLSVGLTHWEVSKKYHKAERNQTALVAPVTRVTRVGTQGCPHSKPTNRHSSFFLETAYTFPLLGKEFSFGIPLGRTRCVLLSCSHDS